MYPYIQSTICHIPTSTSMISITSHEQDTTDADPPNFMKVAIKRGASSIKANNYQFNYQDMVIRCNHLSGKQNQKKADMKRRLQYMQSYNAFAQKVSFKQFNT